MSFTTISFIVFFTFVLIAYYLLPEKYQRFILLIASYIFYGFTSIKALMMMFVITLITYFGGKQIATINDKESAFLKSNELEKAEKKQYKALQQKKRNRVLVSVVVLLLGLLAFFKYSNFVIDSYIGIANLFGVNIEVNHLNILLPVGLSFYIFQSMGYFIDVYRGMVDAEKDITKFALYVSFFPQVLQGPIGDYAKLSPQLYESHPFVRRNVVFGLQRATWGFFKKLVIANSLSMGIDKVFGEYYHYDGIIWILVLGMYSIQLYADFSGYMDIAIGCAQSLGIILDENFTTPYFSKSIAEFWRRWHITLGTWFKNYLFYPLLRTDWLNNMRKKYKKKGKSYLSATLPNVFALVITWFCIGLWHGAAASYILYGVYHGFFVIMDSVLAPVYTGWREKHEKISESKWFNLFRIVRTFIIVTLGYAIFRPVNLNATGYILTHIFTGINRNILGTFLYNYYYYIIAGFIGFIVLFLVDLYHEVNPTVGSLRGDISKKSPVLRVVMYCIGFAAIIYLGTYGDASLNSFAYFQF